LVAFHRLKIALSIPVVGPYQYSNQSTNEEVWARTGPQSIENSLGERLRLAMVRSSDVRRNHQSVRQQVRYTARFPVSRVDQAGQGETGEDVVKKDLQRMGLTWKEEEAAALNGHEWRRSVAPMRPHGRGLNQGRGQMCAVGLHRL